ncbi:VOC family protein [Listeria ilorinensis]|uniref:VOC family protein n=1 Tax=Listeria ilorinensis TaxID=2867439 RepID=UPI001EF57B84|nr:VOC family protein [Listeria ilorinensis]
MTTFQIQKVILKAKNQAELASFYQEVVGLQILKTDQRKAQLGTPDGKVLLEIEQLEKAETKRRATGLYHTAFLVPERTDLADALIHLIRTGYPIAGAGDHAYSEALYLNDPEGNGIEIYADRPFVEWQIDAAGRYPMVTQEVDTESLLAEASERLWNGLPNGTMIGHIHLQIRDIEKTRTFYQELLGLDVKTEIPTALFLAAGDYHHHIGTNIWGGTDLPNRAENEPGLYYFVSATDQYSTIYDRISQAGYPYKTFFEGIRIEDPNGITLHLVPIK